MKIYRYEEIEIFPDKGQTIEQLKAIFQKTQDLTIETHGKITESGAYVFMVKRQLENYPDTMK